MHGHRCEGHAVAGVYGYGFGVEAIAAADWSGRPECDRAGLDVPRIRIGRDRGRCDDAGDAERRNHCGYENPTHGNLPFPVTGASMDLPPDLVNGRKR